ncbi:RNA-directed DNA polymerase, eukaryota [Tanacetum coccineum]
MYSYVLDVYLAARRTKMGTRFGFARFFNVNDIASLEKKLKGITIGGVKIVINIAKYDKQGKKGVEHHHGEPSKVKEVSADPFNIYCLLDKRNNKARTTDSSTSIPYPPGFTPANDIPTCNQDSPDVASVRPTSKSARRNSSPCQSIGLSSRVMEDTVPADVYSSPVGSKPIHGSHKGGSLLEVLDGMIKVELALGSIVAATIEVTLFICSGSVRARGIVETSVSAMVSMMSGGGVPVKSVFQS